MRQPVALAHSRMSGYRPLPNLRMSPSGFHASANGKPSQRTHADERLKVALEDVHAQSRWTYSPLRISAGLAVTEVTSPTKAKPKKVKPKQSILAKLHAHRRRFETLAQSRLELLADAGYAE